MAKWFLNVRIVNLNNPEERMVFEMVARLSQKAGLPAIPDVGIFPSHEANAFATGPSKRRSLVAVSEGLLRQLSKEEVEGVIGHEIAHIANGDMVTMTLLQGVVNAFVMFLARVCAYLLSRDRNGRTNHTSFSLFTFLFELCFMAFGMLVITYFSRLREFRADRGSAKLLGKESMINALRKLQRLSAKEEVEMGSVAALMIASQKKSWSQLLATHPPLEERIARLESI